MQPVPRLDLTVARPLPPVSWEEVTVTVMTNVLEISIVEIDAKISILMLRQPDVVQVVEQYYIQFGGD